MLLNIHLSKSDVCLSCHTAVGSHPHKQCFLGQVAGQGNNNMLQESSQACSQLDHIPTHTDICKTETEGCLSLSISLEAIMKFISCCCWVYVYWWEWEVTWQNWKITVISSFITLTHWKGSEAYRWIDSVFCLHDLCCRQCMELFLAFGFLFAI